MNTNREIVCLSQGQNPNHFQVKFPKNIAIHPESEIGLVSGRVNHNYTGTFDASNNRLTLLFGGNGMEQAATATNNSLDWLSPQYIYLKDGAWNLRGHTNDSAGNSAGIAFGNRSILTNLVDSLNEQNIYFTWQWGGRYTSASAMGIFPYCAAHRSGLCSWEHPIINTLGSGITITNNAHTPAASGFTQFTANAAAGGYTAIGSEPTTLAYSTQILPAGVANNPRLWAEYILPAQAGLVNNRMFAGIVLDHQETYKTREPYNAEQDWILYPLNQDGDPNLLDGAELYRPNMFIYWEIREDTKIFFVRREINDDGTIGQIINETDSGSVYDGTAPRIITFVPEIATAGTATVSTLACKVGAAVAVTYTLGKKEHKYLLRHGLCNDSNCIMEFRGIDKSCFTFNGTGASLGNVDRPTSGANLGNINIALCTDTVNSGEIMVLAPDTTSNYDFYKFTQLNNCQVFRNANYPYYFFSGSVADSGAMVAININDEGIEVPDFHINLENLPVDNVLATNIRGQAVPRVFSKYQENNSDTEVLHPNNIIYHKLHNKQVMMVDRLEIRITDSENRTFDELQNTTMLNFHLRSNPHMMIQQIIGTINNAAQKLETQVVTEEVQELANNVF